MESKKFLKLNNPVARQAEHTWYSNLKSAGDSATNKRISNLLTYCNSFLHNRIAFYK